jgi:tetratricopeptide (TPR) repeat protein
MKGRNIAACLALFFLIGIVAGGYEVSDVQEFLKAGKACFEKNDFSGAALEFENVLLIDPRNLGAKIWLGRTYFELKNRRKAIELFELARTQDPEDPEVLELGRTLGEGPAKVSHRETDLVMHETLTLLGEKKDRPRQYGLVIPESRVRTPEELEKRTKSNTPVEEGDIPLEISPPPTLDEAKTADEGPLFEVFDVWALDGLSAGLQKYFEVVGRTKALSMLNDKNLLREGEQFFQPRFEVNPNDEEAKYFIGMITYFNGDLEKSRKLLEPLRRSTLAQSPGGKLVYAHFDRLQAEEEARRAAIEKEKQRAEEERLAREQAKAEAAAAAAAAKAAQANKSPGGSGKSPPPPPGSPEAVDAEGYDLYKKGQIDVSIEKFQEAIRANGKDPKFYYHLGLALTDKALAGSLPDFDKAVEALNNVIRLEPGSKLAREAEIMIRDIMAAKNSLR